MESLEFYYKEQTALREELRHLKNCQITFLGSSVTATGVLLGVAATLVSVPELGIIFLFPLIVLFPAWWIFFDKATTITRIVGYYRILEGLILQYYSATNFPGWENALCEFRKKRTDGNSDSPEELVKLVRSVLVDIVSLRNSHWYWVISYCIFLTLSGLCAVMAGTAINCFWLFVIVIVFLFSAIWNGWIVCQLVKGRYSYDCNEHFWKKILGVLPKNKIGSSPKTPPFQ